MSRFTAVAAAGLALFLVLAATAAAATPTIRYTIDGISGTSGWYRGSIHGNNVIVHWTVSLDATSTNCLAAVPVGLWEQATILVRGERSAEVEAADARLRAAARQAQSPIL